MNPMSRLLRGLFVLFALLLTFASLCVDWLLEIGTVTDRYGNAVSLLESRRKGEQLTREAQAALERIRVKERIAEALLNDEMTLLEAAACFRSLHEDPRTWHHPFRPRPQRDDREGWCREVIAWIETKVRVEQSPSQADAVRQWLEAELQEQLGCYDTATFSH